MVNEFSRLLQRQKAPCSGVILAGGLNLRFNRQPKALMTIGNKKIIENVFRVFRALFGEIILVTNTPLSYAAWDVSIVADVYPVQSPLTGIYTGLFYATTPHVFVAACDAPFLQQELVKTLLDHIDAPADVILPSTGKGLEPLCAVYSKKCLPHIERVLLNQMKTESKENAPPLEKRNLTPSLKVRSFFDRVRVKTIDETQLREKDPNLISFFNINTPDDLVRAMEMAHETPGEFE